jgi:hypothetical protein
MTKYCVDLKQSIDKLEIPKEIKELLKSNKICSLYELVKKNKSNLKKIGLTPNQISQVEIQLQLKGLDLNMKR